MLDQPSQAHYSPERDVGEIDGDKFRESIAEKWREGIKFVPVDWIRENPQ